VKNYGNHPLEDLAKSGYKLDMKYKKSLIHFSIFVATHSKPFLVHSYSSFHTFGNGKPFNVTSFKIGHVLTNQISLDNKNKKLV